MNTSEKSRSAISISERRLGIDHFIDSQRSSAGKLRELQDDIEVMRAVAGTPNLALEGVLEHLSMHVGALLLALQYFKTELANDGWDPGEMEDAIAQLGDIKATVGRVRGKISAPTNADLGR